MSTQEEREVEELLRKAIDRYTLMRKKILIRHVGWLFAQIVLVSWMCSVLINAREYLPVWLILAYGLLIGFNVKSAVKSIRVVSDLQDEQMPPLVQREKK